MLSSAPLLRRHSPACAFGTQQYMGVPSRGERRAAGGLSALGGPLASEGQKSAFKRFIGELDTSTIQGGGGALDRLRQLRGEEKS